MISAEVLQFLTDHLQTHRIGHSGRTLHAHLTGTCNLLSVWGNRPEVCLAGLYHSIYGTHQFRHQSIPLANRQVIQNLLGDEAERLVYLFCVCKRPQAFLDAYNIGYASSETFTLYDCHCETEAEITRTALINLLEIEAANLLEQGGRIGSFVTQLLATDISDAAKWALRGYLVKQFLSVIRPLGRME